MHTAEPIRGSHHSLPYRPVPPADNTAANSITRVPRGEVARINLSRPTAEENILLAVSRHRNTTCLLCADSRRGIVHNATSYLISPSSSASIAAEIATRCLPWAQRRQLLIYRDRTTEPLTPASTRSIPVALIRVLSPILAPHLPLSSSLSLPPPFPLPFLFHSLSLSFSLDRPVPRRRHRIRFEVDLSLLP